jgi:hypothetical protein
LLGVNRRFADWDLVLAAGGEEASGVLGAGSVAVRTASLAQSRYGERIGIELFTFFLFFYLFVHWDG